MPFLYLPCSHDPNQVLRKSFRQRCSVCNSFWDSEFQAKSFVYSDAYATQRNHFDGRIGALKVNTLKNWIAKAKLDLSNKVVCEVGFGGGFCLAYLQIQAQEALGIEVQQGAIQHAISLGIKAENLFDALKLPATLPQKIDVWIFQDSIEHILPLDPFMSWLEANSSNHCQILMVLPRADSLSQEWMGKLWIHRLSDHLFHWSRQGIISYMGRRSWAVQNEFFPLKCISLEIAVRHLSILFPKLKRFVQAIPVPQIRFWFNFGEMGFRFVRSRNS